VAAFFLLFACVNIAPVANLLFPIGTIMADRLLYLPSLGLCACVVMAVSSPQMTRRSPVAAALVLGLLAAAWGIRTWVRNTDWRDNLTLALVGVKDSPASYKTHFFLANSLYDTDFGHGTIVRVIAEVEKSLAIVEPLPDARKPAALYSAAGGYYMTRGSSLLADGADGETVLTPQSRAAYETSIRTLQRGLAIVAAAQIPGSGPAYPYEANVSRMMSKDYLRLSDFPHALAAALEARRLDPLDPKIHWQLFDVLSSQELAFEASAALMAGGLITGDPSMRQELLRLYQLGLDEKGCAVDPVTGALNPACEVVHNQLCAAALSLGQLSRESPRSAEVDKRIAEAPLPACDVKSR
jgi:hypothetical protein